MKEFETTFNGERQKFHKDTFDNISEERKNRILEVSLREFAANGYNAANINVIAKEAGISIGSLYSYFASKEDLFLTIVDKGFLLIEEVITDIKNTSGGIFEKLEKLFLEAREYAIKYPEMNQVYIDLTTQGLSNLSNRLSNKLETITIELYKTILVEEKPTLKDDINIGVAAFLIDNLLCMYQFSFSSDYYKNRMKLFLGSNNIKDEEVLSELIRFIRNAIEK